MIDEATSKMISSFFSARATRKTASRSVGSLGNFPATTAMCGNIELISAPRITKSP